MMTTAAMDLRLGDCLDELKTLEDESIDLVVTDPPFRVSIGDQTIRTPAYQTLKQLDWGLHLKWLEDTYRAMKNGAQIYVCTSDEDISYLRAAMKELGFVLLGKLVWIETNPLPSYTKKCYRGGLNLAVHARKGERTTYFREQTQQQLVPYWFFPKVGGKKRTKHPTQKPLELIANWVENSCPPGGVVLDPFMGSGTTGEASIKSGHSFVGFENNPEYFEIAKHRLGAI
jgi:site-specific DNA-methyltransferase (adenine-specific)